MKELQLQKQFQDWKDKEIKEELSKYEKYHSEPLNKAITEETEKELQFREIQEILLKLERQYSMPSDKLELVVRNLYSQLEETERTLIFQPTPRVQRIIDEIKSEKQQESPNTQAIKELSEQVRGLGISSEDRENLSQAEGKAFKFMMDNELLTTDPFSPIDFDKMRELPKDEIKKFQGYLKEDDKYNLSIDGKVEPEGKTEQGALKIYDENIGAVMRRIEAAEKNTSPAKQNTPTVEKELEPEKPINHR